MTLNKLSKLRTDEFVTIIENLIVDSFKKAQVIKIHKKLVPITEIIIFCDHLEFAMRGHDDNEHTLSCNKNNFRSL